MSHKPSRGKQVCNMKAISDNMLLNNLVYNFEIEYLAIPERLLVSAFQYVLPVSRKVFIFFFFKY